MLPPLLAECRNQAVQGVALPMALRIAQQQEPQVRPLQAVKSLQPSADASACKYRPSQSCSIGSRVHHLHKLRSSGGKRTDRMQAGH